MPNGDHTSLQRRPTAIPRGPLWSIFALLLVHNVEEGITMQRYLPIVRARAPQALEPVIASVWYPVFLSALALATLIPLGLIAWAAMRPQSRAAQWSAALVQAIIALNVVSHVGAAAALRGYTPGLITAVLLNLPFSAYFFGRAVRDAWLPRRALLATLPAALLAHGPGLLGIFAIARSLTRTP